MKKNLVIFTPLPPTRNGIGDYAASLIDYHKKKYNCIIVISDESPEPDPLLPNVMILRDCEYAAYKHELKDALHLFHIGNNPDHIYMLKYLQSTHSVVVLHDLTLHHLISESFYDGVSNRDQYRNVALVEYGIAGALLAEQAIGQHWRSLANYTEMSCIGLILSSSIGAIVHSSLGLLKVNAARPQLPTYRIPHFAISSNADRNMRRKQARSRLGLDVDDVLLLSLGFITRAKQILDFMDALLAIRAQCPRIKYLIVGQENEFVVSEEAARRGLSDIIMHVDYVLEEDIAYYLDAADILINLRYPTSGETSGTLCRALARGVCSIVSDHGWYAELPDAVVAKVPAGDCFKDVIAGTLLALIVDSVRRCDMENIAASWSAEVLNLPAIALQYHNALEACYIAIASSRYSQEQIHLSQRLTSADLAVRASQFSQDLQPILSSDYIGVLWWSEGAMPLPEPGCPILLSGPPRAGLALSEFFNVKVVYEKCEALSYGLYIGSWSDLINNDNRFGCFQEKLSFDGCALINLWHHDLDDKLTFTIKKVVEYMSFFEFEIIHIVDGPSQPLPPILASSVISEIALIVRRASARTISGWSAPTGRS